MPKTKTDHALSTIKALISAVPIVGGPIASLIGDYIPTSTQKTIDEAIKKLAQKLNALEGRLDPVNINKDEFSEIFKSAYLTIVRTHQKEKIEAATNLISNILLNNEDPEKLTFTEADHFARCIDQLSIGAIKVLSVAADITKVHFDGDLRKASDAPYDKGRRFNFDVLKERFPDYYPSLLMGLVGELDALNLLHKAGTPTIRTANYANYPIELTVHGIKFIISLLEPSAK